MIALTATAEPHTRKDILERLGLQKADCSITGFDRPTSVMPWWKNASPLAVERLPAFPADSAGLFTA
jgi:ATP-dependent DNA helicase RecQ